jgi:D-glycero-alpha-D-manno-heptose-7-phosphate kinase
MDNGKILRVAKAPMRISFIGGGSDFTTFYSKSPVPGRVLGTTINKFVYVMASEHPEFEPFKYKFTYRKTEEVNEIDAFEHPVVRATLQKLDWNTPLNIATMASLPGRSGLGSSSAFTVALLAALNQQDEFSDRDRERLAVEAIDVERNRLNEGGGVQDQYHAAFGGFRLYEFKKNSTTIHPRSDDTEFLKLLDNSLYLVATGSPRSSHFHSSKAENRISEEKVFSNLVRMSELARETFMMIGNSNTPEKKMEFLKNGLRESWQLKEKNGVMLSAETQKILELASSLGADSFKLCGAGGSGFVAFLTTPVIAEKMKSTFGLQNVFRPGISRGGVELVNV